ncbi:hypothetical protein Tco_0307552 [Tanacetum coccineum]
MSSSTELDRLKILFKRAEAMLFGVNIDVCVLMWSLTVIWETSDGDVVYLGHYRSGAILMDPSRGVEICSSCSIVEARFFSHIEVVRVMIMEFGLRWDEIVVDLL